MINLYGGLARSFQKRYGENPKAIPIIVNSAQEAIKAMDANFPGFRSLIRRKGYYRVVRGQDVINGQDINEEEVKVRFADDTWHFMPIAAGAKGGVIQLVLGAILIVVGICLYYTPFGVPLIMMGAGLMLSGLATMLTPMPEMQKKQGGDDTPSYLFNGAINVAEPGLTVPVAYGETWIGDIPISFGVQVEEWSAPVVAAVPVAAPVAATPPTEPAVPQDNGGGGGDGPSGGSSGDGSSGGDGSGGSSSGSGGE
jgi:predicted phage tail protein